MSTPSIHDRLAALGISEGIQEFSNANPATNPVDIFRSYIATTLGNIAKVDPNVIYPALDWGTKTSAGDLKLAVPRLRLAGNAAELARTWADEFPENKFISHVRVDGPFMQFYFSPSLLGKIVVPAILTSEDKYGTNDIGKGKTALIEFSSPNMAKPFHVGHLRSTILGSFLSNLHEACGWKVIRMNYLGDWGKQFGLLAIGFERFGNEEALEENADAHLYEVYVKINTAAQEDPSLNDAARDYFRRMENGDEQALSLWRRFRDLSISKSKKTYARLNIEYDEYSGESQVSPESMEKAMEKLEQKKLLTYDEGAILVDLTKYSKKLGRAMVQKKDGTTLYLTRDIGAAIERYDKYKMDKMIYVVATQQDLHLAQLFKILDLMEEEVATKCLHINYGMVKGMSTRKGTAVFLDTILDQTKDSMHEVMKKNEVKYVQVENPDRVADTVGMAAVMVQDMSAKRINNYDFSWSRMLSFEGDTGPYLEYAHSRLCSMERRAGFSEEQLRNADLSLITEPIGIALLRILATYPDVVLNAYKAHEPSSIVTFLFKMTHTVSSCYDIMWVANQEEKLASARLALYSSAKRVLANGLRLLGITPVTRYFFPISMMLIL